MRSFGSYVANVMMDWYLLHPLEITMGSVDFKRLEYHLWRLNLALMNPLLSSPKFILVKITGV